MCGIVGYTGSRPAVPILIQGLRRLEYRGYDSAGVAFGVESQGRHRIELRKAEGKLSNVETLLSQGDGPPASARCGIGHTRWATHGKPTTQNAHPHQTGHVVLVHNGIIENYQALKDEILKRGHQPKSETDSELFGFLVLDEMEKKKSLRQAVSLAFQRIEGQSSVVVLSEKEPGVIVGARNGSPLVAALDPQGGSILASDAQPLIEFTQDVYFLEHGELVEARPEGLRFFAIGDEKEISRTPTKIDWSLEKLDRGGYAHYMLKEIHEQPTALIDTLNGLLDRARTDPFPMARQPGADLLDRAKAITLVACGTSWHAALTGQYWLERIAGIPARVELASEFRYRKPALSPDSLLIAISQSGETADTLAVLRQAEAMKIPSLGIANVRGCSMAREADALFYTSAGPEIGVAATKTFLAQLEVLFLFAGYLGLKRGGKEAAAVGHLFEEFVRVPHVLSDALSAEKGIVSSAREVASKLQDIRGFFFIGRGSSYPIALEGALKLKEIAYVHAEGYAAGELKHGPIAMIDPTMAVVVLAPTDGWREKTISNLEEVRARGARVVGVGHESDTDLQRISDLWLPLPQASKDMDENLQPFFLAPVMQLLSYELALLKGTDVDKPRNLAKSVTVE